MADGQCLLFQYLSLFPPGSAGYVRPVVKIELGARSDDWPHETKTIRLYVIKHFPVLDPAPAFPVQVLSAERTFLEKACLLHEETSRPADKPRKLRMARHYYASGVCYERASASRRWRTGSFSDGAPTIAKSSSATRGSTTQRTSLEHLV